MGLQSHSALLLLLFLVPATLAASSCNNTSPCIDQPDCTACAANEKVPDPDNCRGYYLCDASEDYYDLPFQCNSGEVFNVTTRSCVPGDTCESCESKPGASCSYDCPASGTVNIPVFADCHNYYECDTGSIVGSGSCSGSTPFFDGAECQEDETKCCHCHAFCRTADLGKYVPDPLDCRGFYLCLAEGIPDIYGSCTDGTFDTNLQGCSDIAPCVTQCTNVVGADGCIEPFTCTTLGFFAKCPKLCTADYYHCTELTGTYQAVETCSSGTVFHPDSHTCVDPGMCPYEEK